jgi:hypothetical protein
MKVLGIIGKILVLWVALSIIWGFATRAGTFGWVILGVAAIIYFVLRGSNKRNQQG